MPVKMSKGRSQAVMPTVVPLTGSTAETVWIWSGVSVAVVVVSFPPIALDHWLSHIKLNGVGCPAEQREMDSFLRQRAFIKLSSLVNVEKISEQNRHLKA
mmetsp:Transcript_41070/g.92703  ORF Transcript_41070/g.92703 Transcript_41070/m.92703 type:complete len:100 (+) Transcript_41070:259-558(+)